MECRLCLGLFFLDSSNCKFVLDFFDIPLAQTCMFHTSQWPCSLGQLGRLLGDGPCTPPRRRDVVGAPSRRDATTPCLREVRQVAHDLLEVGFEPHSWRALLAGARPERNEVDEFEWGCGIGWQHEAASRVERHHRDDHIFPHLTDPARALLLAQGGPGSGLAFSTCPTCCITRMGAQHFRILLLRRLQLPLPLTVRSCRCGRPLDIYGHHRAACARAGVLGRRGFALESVVARICREAGGRVSTNVFVRDLDLHLPNAADGRRLEVAVDGLPLFGGAQLALDTTLVSALHCDGAISVAERRKEQRYPELVAGHGGWRQVVFHHTAIHQQSGSRPSSGRRVDPASKSSGTLFSRVWRHDPQSASGLAQFSTCITDFSS